MKKVARRSDGKYWASFRGFVDDPDLATPVSKEHHAVNQGGCELVELPTYDHAFDVAFSVKGSCSEEGEVSPRMLRAALLRRIVELDEGEAWLEACGRPFDTFEEE